jgi:hypothetical protein
MEMYTTYTLMQQNKKLKKDVDFPIPETSYEKVKSKMHKFDSRNARILGSPLETTMQKKECNKNN